MIDPGEADRSLARALDDLAAVMARRQEIRRLRAELAGADDRDLPGDSPARQALNAQRNRVDRLWRDTGASANRILAALNAAALAGENLIREQRIGETARDAERVITRIAAAGLGRTMDAAPELAERTAAVIAAYRELAAER
jgi:cell division septum initiation protein DivIVA